MEPKIKFIKLLKFSPILIYCFATVARAHQGNSAECVPLLTTEIMTI